MVTSSTLPSGNITILFTDIENSAGLNRVLGNDLYFHELLEEHFKRLRKCVSDFNGMETGTPAGDSLMVVFQEAGDALNCANAMQDSLTKPRISYSPNGSTYEIKIRIGIHRSARVMVPDIQGLYVGEDVNLAKRVESLGSGDQIFVHKSAYSVSGNQQRFQWSKGYACRLKGYEHPQTVYELQWDKKARGEPGGRYFADWDMGELDVYIPRLKKENEIVGYFTRQIALNPVRLVTLRGFGGMGKTRLAMACARQLVTFIEGRVCYVQLKNTPTDSQAVAIEIGRACRLSQDQWKTTGVIESLKEESLLLILDNYESAACVGVQDFLEELLLATRNLKLLVTGRKLVGSKWEKEVCIEGLTDAEARKLFVARSQLKGRFRTWKPTSADEKEALNSILTATDRIPLALEIVAAGLDRVGTENIIKLSANVSMSSLVALREGAELNPLRIVLDWSYENLPDNKTQKALACLGLFADSFAIDRVEEACSLTNANNTLDNLKDASLLRYDEKRDRYCLLRPTREYAQEKLDSLPNKDSIKRKFVEYYTEMVELYGGYIYQLDAEKMKVLDAEWRNIVGAIETAKALQDKSSWRKLVEGLGAFLLLFGLWSERKLMAEHILEDARKNKDLEMEELALDSLGLVYERTGDFANAHIHYQEGLTIARMRDNTLGIGMILNSLGNIYRFQGDLITAEDHYLQSIATFEDTKSAPINAARPHKNLGVVYTIQMHWEKALHSYNISLDICEKAKDLLGVGEVLCRRGNLYLLRNDMLKAEDDLKKSLRIREAHHDSVGIARTRFELGDLLQTQGEVDLARREFEASLKLWKVFGDAKNIELTEDRINNL